MSPKADNGDFLSVNSKGFGLAEPLCFSYLPLMQELLNLQWCIGSAPLIESSALRGREVVDLDWCHLRMDEESPLFEYILAHPGKVRDYVDGDDARLLLGKRFERYISFWLEHSEQWELLARNVQIKADSHTVGEFDFLARYLPSDEVVHFEVACKFYLASQHTRSPEAFVGPSGRDRLADKLTTLRRQLSLSHHPAAAEELKKRGIGRVCPMALVKGFFFYHYTHLIDYKSPHGAHPKHRAGWWAYEREMGEVFGSEAAWALLPKSDWLAESHFQFSDEQVLSSRQMPQACADHIAAYGRAVMVVQLMLEEGVWNELSRGVVVTNRWPRIR